MPQASKSLPLRRLERWFQTRIHRPQEMEHAPLPSPAPEREILPSAHLNPGERLDLYSDMYFARLHDALAEDYPAVRRQLGELRFERVAREYFQAFPSKHYSLNFLGGNFPRFLAAQRTLPGRMRLHDLAATENAMSEVFDEREASALRETDFQAIPAQAWQHAKLRLHPALRLLALDHAVNPAINASREGQGPRRVPKRKTWLAVYRKNDRVWRMELAQPHFEALSALARGATLERALRRFAKFWRGTDSMLSVQVHRAFLEWAREGFFVSITTLRKRKDLRT